MRKEIIQVALAVTLATASLSPIVIPLREPIRVEAAYKTNYPSWFTPNPDFKPLHPTDLTKNGDYGSVYYRSTTGNIRQIIEQNGREGTPSQKEGTLSIRDAKGDFRNGEDITEYITQATTPMNYLNRVQYYYTPGYIDTPENAKTAKATSYYFTAPFTGQFRFRFVGNECPYSYLGVGIYEGDSSKFVSSEKSKEIFSGSGNGEFYACDVVKGKKYRISFATFGGDIEQKFEMFFMKMMDNEGGKRIYKQDKWYTYTTNWKFYGGHRKGSSNTYSYRKELTRDLREGTIKVDLDCDRKVTLELRALNYTYEGWKEELKDYGVYTKRFLDEEVVRYGVEPWVNIQTFSKPKEISNDTFKVTLNLKKGSYYLPVVMSGVHFDIAFKYKVEPVITTYTPKVTAYKAGTTYVKGNCIANTTAVVKIGSKSYKDTTTAAGIFSIKVPTLKKGTKLSVYTKDSKGHTSKTKTVTVK